MSDLEMVTPAAFTMLVQRVEKRLSKDSPEVRRMVRELERREKRLGVQLVHRTDGGHRRVSVWDARKHCPDLFRRYHHDLFSAVRVLRADLRRDIQEAVRFQTTKRVEPQIRNLSQDADDLAGSMRQCVELVREVVQLVRAERDQKGPQRGA